MTTYFRLVIISVLIFGSTMVLLGAVPSGGSKPMREVVEKGYRVELDLSEQVLVITIPEERHFGVGSAQEEAPISPTLEVSGAEGFVSASILAMKAKQFDDGLYAAVELAAQEGAGRFAGKSFLLRGLAQHLADSAVSQPVAVLFGACRLGRIPVRGSDSIVMSADRVVGQFLGDPLRSKPIGFYTWSDELKAIFQQDRMLQTKLEGKQGIAELVEALHSDPKTRAVYVDYLTFVSKLTNPLVGSSLQGSLTELDQGQFDPPEKDVAFFPPSRSHETELIKKLYANQPIPPGFNLADELIRRIQAGQISLQPTDSSGWYDYQTWALEPMVVPDKMPEASHLKLSESYRKQLLELFKGIIALTRETHIKQLEIPRATAAPIGQPATVIAITPDLSAEPLMTHYLRRAQSYQFVRDVLDAHFGKETLRQMHRLTADGALKLDLASELDKMQSIFLGAATEVGRQLGMPPRSLPEPSNNATFSQWAKSLPTDPDVGRDARMMVPVFYDLQRGKTKVWAFLGWSHRPVIVSFATPPKAEVFKAGKKLDRDAPQIFFTSRSYSLAYPVTAEVYVSDILNRDEFRKHCDQYKTQSAILKKLR